jgi:hypothetical protein
MKIALFVASFAGGIVVALLAFFMAAGGHGWTAPMISATALLTAPAGAATWLLRHRVAAIVVTSINVVADIAFLVVTARTLRDAASTFEHLWPLVIAWALIWLAVQIPPARAATVAA